MEGRYRRMMTHLFTYELILITGKLKSLSKQRIKGLGFSTFIRAELGNIVSSHVGKSHHRRVFL
jgi:hypothetical protein